MGEKVTYYVHGAFASEVVDNEVRRNAEGARFSQMIGTLVAEDVPFAQIAGEAWRVRRSARGVAALLPVEIVAADIDRFAQAIKRRVAGPGLTDVSVETFRGETRTRACDLLFG